MVEKININPDIFRKYDIRGLAGEDLNSDFVRLLGYSAAEFFENNGEKKVLIDRDNRKSSCRIRDELIQGLTAYGCKVIDIGEVITPIFYYSRHLLDIDAGIMITASHNPGDYNGFKIASGYATIFGDQILELKDRMEQILKEDTHFNKMLKNGFQDNEEKVKKYNPVEDYFEMFTNKIELGPRELKIVIDCGNGTASLFAVDCLERLGCEVIPLYCESDPDFPNHHPDPIKSENLIDLKELVFKAEADLGISFDGDGDRLGVVDDAGSIVWGDRLMCIFWQEILPKYPGTKAIVEVKCSQALVDEVKRLGGEPIYYKTGHSFIKNKMKEIDAVFTGEMSGHMFFADEYYGFDDALYAAGRLLRILSNSSKTLSDMMEELPKYYSTAETRISCSDSDKFVVVAELTEKFKEEFEVIDVDGARIIFPEGWGLVRASNTQPAIVARCEGKTPEALERISARLKRELQNFEQVSQFEWEF